MRDVIRHLALAASIATALVPCAARSAPDTTALSDVPTTTYHVNGLNAPAEILIGVFGVPHLYADRPVRGLLRARAVGRSDQHAPSRPVRLLGG
jgi:hypothetical protein